LGDYLFYNATCDSVDRIESTRGKFHRLPSNVDVGDWLVLETMGAYTTMSGASFNGIDPAGGVMCWEEQGELRWKVSPHFHRSTAMLNALSQDTPLRSAE
jgi:hypothetical protein